MLDRELARGDDALGLVADVEQDLVAVHLHDGAVDDVAVVEVLDGLVDGGEEVLFGPDVVDRDLRGVRIERGVIVIREWIPWMDWCRADAPRSPVSLPVVHGPSAGAAAVDR